MHTKELQPEVRIQVAGILRGIRKAAANTLWIPTCKLNLQARVGVLAPPSGMGYVSLYKLGRFARSFVTIGLTHHKISMGNTAGPPACYGALQGSPSILSPVSAIGMGCSPFTVCCLSLSTELASALMDFTQLENPRGKDICWGGSKKKGGDTHERPVCRRTLDTPRAGCCVVP